MHVAIIITTDYFTVRDIDSHITIQELLYLYTRMTCTYVNYMHVIYNAYMTLVYVKELLYSKRG